MPRRVSLPAADELFRTTGGAAVQPSAPQQNPQQNGRLNGEAAPDPDGATPPPAPSGGAKVPAPASEPAPQSTGAEHAATGDPQGETGGSAAEHAGGRGRGTARTDEQRPASPPQQAGPAPAERSTRRTGTAKSRQATGSPAAGSGAAPRRGRAARRPSGRERHDEKITVYVSAEELMDLEHARLVLRGEHGLAVDRGRIVREAVAVVLADLESRGDASILVRRLRGR
ncbi:hypothetical protein SUDANB19_01414 [Streptomyces sp. enrichment culture]